MGCRTDFRALLFVDPSKLARLCGKMARDIEVLGLGILRYLGVLVGARRSELGGRVHRR